MAGVLADYYVRRGAGRRRARSPAQVSFATIAMQGLSSPEWRGLISWLIFWMLIELAAAFVLASATLASFDRCVGRITTVHASHNGQRARIW